MGPSDERTLAPLFLRKHCGLASPAYKVSHPRGTHAHWLLGLLACINKMFHLSEIPEPSTPLSKALQVPNIIIDTRKNPLQKCLTILSKNHPALTHLSHLCRHQFFRQSFDCINQPFQRSLVLRPRRHHPVL